MRECERARGSKKREAERGRERGRGRCIATRLGVAKYKSIPSV